MAIAEIHQDIIQTHILTRLDGQTLLAAGCTSSELHSLCTHQKLWSDICTSSWPSTADPLVLDAISNFPSGHRSLFSDSFPSPCHRVSTTPSSTTSSHLISAVDLRYLGELVFSKVESTEITSSNEWFETSPLRIDLLEPKEIVSSPVKFSGDVDGSLQPSLEKHMTLSWILIDPTRNRSVNISSTRPVSVQRNWLTGDVQVKFAVVIAVDRAARGALRGHEYVNCSIEVTCGVKEDGGELHVSGVSLTIQDMDGKSLSGKDSMVILQGVMVGERKRRGRGREGEEERERYEEYMERRRERKEMKERRERRLDMVCIAGGVAIFMAFWSFVLH